jgi:hypothetical protein
LSHTIGNISELTGDNMPTQPDNGNPFDTPLASEVQDHQQAQATTTQASDNDNPFNEPLLSEKAETPTDAQVAYRKATAAGPNITPGGAEKVMGEQIGDNKAQAIFAAKNLGMATAATAGGVLGASAVGAAVPALYDAAIGHLDQLTKVVRAARALGWTSFGLKEAHDVYKMVAGDDKK